MKLCISRSNELAMKDDDVELSGETESEAEAKAKVSGTWRSSGHY